MTNSITIMTMMNLVVSWKWWIYCWTMMLVACLDSDTWGKLQNSHVMKVTHERSHNLHMMKKLGAWTSLITSIMSYLSAFMYLSNSILLHNFYKLLKYSKNFLKIYKWICFLISSPNSLMFHPCVSSVFFPTFVLLHF